VRLSEKIAARSEKWLTESNNKASNDIINLEKRKTLRKNNNYLTAGLIAELRVYQDLLSAGYNVHKSDQNISYDLLAEKNGKCLRIQVKHTGCYRLDRNSYQFKTNRSQGRTYTQTDADIFALVVNEKAGIYYCKVENINKLNLYVKQNMFDEKQSVHSRKICFAKLEEKQEYDDPDRLLKKRLVCAVTAAESFCRDLVLGFGEEIENDSRFSLLALVETYIEYALKITPKWLLEASVNEPINGSIKKCNASHELVEMGS